MKRIALINDLSGFGKCSLTAAIPVISVMGLQACPLPTAILSAQTGFEQFFYDDYIDRMNLITDSWSKMGDVSFDGICSGYLGSPKQIENVFYFLKHFKNDSNILLVDPIMGDNGKRMKAFSDELLIAMKALTRKANVITPNLTEACFLADADYEELMKCSDKEDFLAKVNGIAACLTDMAEVEQKVIVTGVVHEKWNPGKVGNMIVSAGEMDYLESDYIDKSFSGTGDLFASVVIGSLVRGMTVREAVLLAMNFIEPAIKDASAEGVPRNHGVAFEKYLSVLI